MDLVPLFLMSPILVAAAWFDLTQLRIPNYLGVMLVVLFVFSLPFLGWPELGWRLLAAVTILVAGLGAFALNLFGGGDVKFLSALVLQIPSYSWPLFALTLAASMLFGIALVTFMRAVPWFEGSTMLVIRESRSFPMGIAFGLAGLAHPLVLNALTY